MRSAIAALSLLALAIATGESLGQVTASAMFCVDVNSVQSLQPPAGPISIIHDGTNDIQDLATTQWPCLANDSDGSVVTFSTLTGFVHATLPLEVRDVELSLAIDSSAAGSGWAVTVATDQTDVGATLPDIVATVQAESTAAGSATFALSVGFVTDDVSTLVPGLYCTTVVGTITAK